MSACKNPLRKSLVDFSYGQVDAGAYIRIKEHIEECSQCADEYAGIQELSLQLREIPDVEPPVDLCNRILKIADPIFAERLAPTTWRRVVDWFANPVQIGVAVAVAALALAIFPVHISDSPHIVPQITKFEKPENKMIPVAQRAMKPIANNPEFMNSNLKPLPAELASYLDRFQSEGDLDADARDLITRAVAAWAEKTQEKETKSVAEFQPPVDGRFVQTISLDKMPRSNRVTTIITGNRKKK